MASGSNQDWRGGRSRRSSPAGEKPTPDWKKSGRITPIRTRGWKSRLSIIAAVFTLILLTGIAIILWLPGKSVHTHFVILNFRSASIDFDAAKGLELPDALKKNTYTREVSRSIPKSLGLVDPNDKAGLKSLNDANVVVIFLQTNFVPASNDKFLCLVPNSTPDLGANEFVQFEKLKDDIAQLTQAGTAEHILLIVDSPPSSLEWRTGVLHTDLAAELDKWCEEIPQLLVVQSCSSDSNSEPGTMNSDGQSIFSHFCSLGFSQFATRNPKGDLTAGDFLRYVDEHTDEWVRNHRNPTGQTIQVFPSDSNLRRQREAFVLMRDVNGVVLPTDSIVVAGSGSKQFISQLADLWTQRELLGKRGANLWSPVLWRLATDELKRSERACLHGQASGLDNGSPGRAVNAIKLLQNEAQQICPQVEDLYALRGIFRTQIEQLPSGNRLTGLFPLATESKQSSESKLIEEVLNDHLAKFASREGHEAIEIEKVVDRRRAAEVAVSQLLRSSVTLKSTVRRLENDLLLSEDRRFTKAAIQPEDESHLDRLILAMTAFAESHDSAETSLWEGLDVFPDLTLWASRSSQFLNTEDELKWRNALAGNSLDKNITLESRNGVLDALNEMIPTDSDEELSRRSASLRREIFQLAVILRGLRQSLESFDAAESNHDYEPAELEQKTAELQSWQKETSEAIHRTLDAAEKCCLYALDLNPAERIEKVKLYRFLRGTLDFSCVTASTRKAVLEKLQSLDTEFAASNDKVAKTNSFHVENQSVTTEIEALWLLQIFHLLPCSESQLLTRRKAWDLLPQMSGEDMTARHNAVAQFSENVREIWKRNQTNVKAALATTSDDAFVLAMAADLQSRLFSGFDAKMPQKLSASARLRLLRKWHYCEMQAERLLAGLWIAPDEVKEQPYSANGWYAKALNDWLEHASAVQKELATPGAAIPVFVAAEIEQLRSRLKDSDNLKMSITPTTKDLVDLGDESTSIRTETAQISGIVPTSVSGEAALIFTPDSAGQVTIDSPLSIPVVEKKSTIDFQISRVGAPRPGEGCAAISLQPSLFFRGRYWNSELPLAVSTCEPEKFTTEILARPLTASVKVSGFDPRPVVLILDYSASMMEPTASGRLRFEVALETLKQLSGREELQGSKVILKVFGHRTKTLKKDGEIVTSINENYRAQFKHKILQAAIDANSDIENEFEGRFPADKEEFERILKLLESSLPSGITPLIGSLRSALENDLKGLSGIVIAVTDGEPTDDGVGKDEPDKTEFLRKALEKKKDSVVRIVAFDVNARPAERARLETTFRRFGNRIQIVDASEPDQLTRQIQESLDPRKFKVLRQNEPDSMRETELDSVAESLPPAADYSVSFGNSFLLGTEKSPLVLSPGDALQLDILLAEQRFRVWRMSSTSKPAAANVRFEDDRPWILKSVEGVQVSDIPGIDSQKFGKAVLRLMLDHEREDQFVRQPAEVEFVVRYADTLELPNSVQMEFDSSCGAPAWKITIDKWTKGKHFLVDAHWKMERSIPDKVIGWDKLSSFDGYQKSLRIDEAGRKLPACSVWTRLRDNIPAPQFEVRIDPLPGHPSDESNLAENVRIEIGQRGALENDSTFRPWEMRTEIIRTKRGSVIYRFTGNQINSEKLKSAEIAFTSQPTRRADAMEVRKDQIDYP